MYYVTGSNSVSPSQTLCNLFNSASAERSQFHLVNMMTKEFYFLKKGSDLWNNQNMKTMVADSDGFILGRLFISGNLWERKYFHSCHAQWGLQLLDIYWSDGLRGDFVVFCITSCLTLPVRSQMQFPFNRSMCCPSCKRCHLTWSMKCHLKLLLVFTLFATATYFCEDVHQTCFLSASGSVNDAKAKGFIFTRSTSTVWLMISYLPKSREWLYVRCRELRHPSRAGLWLRMAKNDALFVEKVFKGAAMHVKKSSFVSCLTLHAERCYFKGPILSIIIQNNVPVSSLPRNEKRRIYLFFACSIFATRGTTLEFYFYFYFF